MRMMQYEVKLNMDDGTGYYVSACNSEEDARYFRSEKGQPIGMRILSHRGERLVTDITLIEDTSPITGKCEQEFREHLEEIFQGNYLDWRLTHFEVCAESLILGYYKPNGKKSSNVTLNAESLHVEFDVPGRDGNSTEKYDVKQSKMEISDGATRSSTWVTEQINGVVRDVWFTHDSNQPVLERYAVITEYAG